nr:hypothetical protein BaRGS_025366 [Batillaria attramentaria]
MNLSGCDVDRIHDDGFQSLTQLRVVDLRGCPLRELPRTLFSGVKDLELVRADTYRLCCPGLLPEDFNLLQCHAPSDEVSSCDSLLSSNAHRVFFVIVALLALLGNMGSYLYHVIRRESTSVVTFDVCLLHLYVADFLKGVYTSVISFADMHYRGSYFLHDVGWRNSAMCQVTGFLFLSSTEASVLIIFLATLDRFLENSDISSKDKEREDGSWHRKEYRLDRENGLEVFQKVGQLRTVDT